MKAREVAPPMLHDTVQQTVARLEQSKEQINRQIQSAHERLHSLEPEAAQLDQKARELSARIPGMELRCDTAQRRLYDLALGGVASLLAQSAEEHASARADLAVAQLRAEQIKERRIALDEERRALEQKLEYSAALLERVSGSIAFLTAHFRELGSHLESAQQSRALGMHVIRAQEEERRRLAREIHDGPTQLLNSVVLRIDVCQRFFDSDPQRLRDELGQLKELVRLSLQDVRKIIFDLRPMSLDDLGLVPALRGFLKDYQGKSGIESEFVAFGNERRYDPSLEIALFRIVQEALTNVNKHAGAVRVWVKVDTAGGREIKVSVKDDGAGFDASKIGPGAGGTKFGLVAMRERAELLGGSMEIQSAPGQGTKLSFCFPVVD